VYSIGDDDEPIGGLADGSTYFVRAVDENTISLHGSRADAENGVNAINLEPASDADNAHALQPGVPATVLDLIASGRLEPDGSAAPRRPPSTRLQFGARRHRHGRRHPDGAVTVTATMDATRRPPRAGSRPTIAGIAQRQRLQPEPGVHRRPGYGAADRGRRPRR
jgi:hypothetical protein